VYDGATDRRLPLVSFVECGADRAVACQADYRDGESVMTRLFALALLALATPALAAESRSHKGATVCNVTDGIPSDSRKE
jgi:hypothetical protein